MQFLQQVAEAAQQNLVATTLVAGLCVAALGFVAFCHLRGKRKTV